MIIVLEGSDCTGKSTLAQEFVKRGFKYEHFGVPAPDEDLFKTYTDALLNAQGDVVFDRLHVGALVYAEIMRNSQGPMITVTELRLLNRLILGLGGAIVFCETYVDDILKLWRERQHGEYVKAEERLQSIIVRYHDLYIEELLLLPNVLTYDFARYRGNPGIFAQCIINPEMQAAFQHNDAILPLGLIGSPTRKYVLIGEQIGGDKSYDLAFYNANGSSDFLNTALWEAGYQEHELAFTNAYDRDGEARNLYRLYRNRPGQIFIALGRVAGEQCAHYGVPYLQSPHPQYVKRFQSNRRNKYVGLLRSFRGEE